MFRSVLETGFLADHRQQVDRNDVHEIHQQDPAENGQRQRCDQLAGAVEGVAYLRVDEIDHHFDKKLEFPRHAGGGLACRKVERDHEHQAEHHGEEDAVDVVRPETFATLEIEQMVADVLVRRWTLSRCVF